MNIKVRKENKDGMVRLETSGPIREVLIQEDFMHPQKEKIQICFVGANSSGIVELTTKELESLYTEVRKNLHLVKKSKIIG